MTDPITSILYITSDKNHMELIKDTLHVHKVVEGQLIKCLIMDYH